MAKWNPPPVGSKKRKEMPSSYFLVPSQRKYPYKTREGKISCAGLRSAMRVAAFRGNKAVLAKAKRLYEKHCKK